MHLLDLNDDILFHVFDHIDPQDCMNLKQTSKTFLRLLTGRGIWMRQINNLLSEGIQLAQKPPLSIESLSLADLQKLAYRTSVLDRKWRQPSFSPTMIHTLPFRVPSSQKRYHLKFIGNMWLLSSHDSTLEVWNIENAECVQTYRTQYPIAYMEVNEICAASMIVLSLDHPSDSGLRCLLQVLKLSYSENKEALEFETLWQEQLSVHDFRRVGPAWCSEKLLAIPVTKTDGPIIYGVIVVDWSLGKSRLIEIPEWHEIKITLHEQTLLVTLSLDYITDTLHVIAYDISAVFKTEEPLAPLLCVDQLEPKHSFKINNVLPPGYNSDKYFTVVLVSASMSISRASTYRIQIPNAPGISCSSLQVLSRNDIKPDDNYFPYGLNARFFVGRHGMRARSIQTLFTFGRRKDFLSAHLFGRDGSTTISRIEFPVDCIMDNTSSHAFDETLGAVAWIPKGDAEIKICRFS